MTMFLCRQAKFVTCREGVTRLGTCLVAAGICKTEGKLLITLLHSVISQTGIRHLSVCQCLTVFVCCLGR